MNKVRIISIRLSDGYVTSEIFESLDIEKIVSKFLSVDEDFDEFRVIFPDLSERIWRPSQLEIKDEEEE